MLYKVKNATKKSIIETETWYNESINKELTIETVWRGGEYIIESEEPLEAEIEEAFVVTDHYIEDTDVYDGVSVEFEVHDPEMSDQDRENFIEGIEHIFEEDGFMGLEDAGWDHMDTEVVIYNGVEVEAIEG